MSVDFHDIHSYCWEKHGTRGYHLIRHSNIRPDIELLFRVLEAAYHFSTCVLTAFRHDPGIHIIVGAGALTIGIVLPNV